MSYLVVTSFYGFSAGKSIVDVKISHTKVSEL